MIKYSGAGNTFVIAEGEGFEPGTRQMLAKKICHSITGVCADGALFLDKGDRNCDWVWDFYNSDGSKAEMCGNAARCATQFVYEELKHIQKNVSFLTKAGLIHCRINGSEYEVEMPKYKILDANKQVILSSGSTVSGVFIDSGVPHFVIERPVGMEYQKFAASGREIRNHSDFHPQGTNVTFLERLDMNSIRAVSFERGVEDFTLACGTGAVASAVAWNLVSQRTEVVVKMPGGDIKVVLLRDNSAIMVGPSQKIAEIKWISEL